MSAEDTTQDRIGFGLVGVLLGLLVDAITNIHFEKYSPVPSLVPYFEISYLQIIIVLAVYFLLMSTILEFSIIYHIPLTKDIKINPKKALESSIKHFISGLLMVIALIISIAFNNVTYVTPPIPVGLLCSVLILIAVYFSNSYYSNRYKLNYTETEEQLTCCGEVGLLALAGESDKKA